MTVRKNAIKYLFLGNQGRVEERWRSETIGAGRPPSRNLSIKGCIWKFKTDTLRECLCKSGPVDFA